MNSIFHRVSIRKYQEKKIEQEKVEQLLRAVILSILVDTFISKISFPMQPGPEIGSISDA